MGERPEPPPGRYYSVSQIKTYRRCPLKWYLDKLWFQDRSPDSKAQARGKRYHDALETYIRGGFQDPDFERLWQMVNDPLAQDILAGCVPEDEMLVDLRPYGIGGPDDPVWFWGFPDAHKPGVVFDLKTTRSMGNAMRPAQLSRDLQGLSYAKGLGYSPCRLVWGYVQVEGAADYDVVEVTVDEEQIEDEWALTLATIREMEKTRAQDRPENVKAHDGLDGRPLGCKDYGGCPRKGVCRDGVDKLVKIDSQTEPPEIDFSGIEPATGLLLINTVAPKGLAEVVMFEDWIAPIAAEFRDKFGKDWALMKFREGSGPMAVAMWDYPLPTNLALHSAHPLYAEARQALVPRFDVVLEGTR